MAALIKENSSPTVQRINFWLVYIRCNNKDFSEDDLESSLQLLAEEDE